MKRLIIAMSGASGQIYGIRLLEVLREVCLILPEGAELGSMTYRRADALKLAGDADPRIEPPESLRQQSRGDEDVGTTRDVARPSGRARCPSRHLAWCASKRSHQARRVQRTTALLRPEPIPPSPE